MGRKNFLEPTGNSGSRCNRGSLGDLCKCHHCKKEEESLVERVVCSKNVYSTAEFLLPFALDTGTLPTGPPIGPVITAIAALGLRADVRPVEGQINTEVTVLKDAVMVFGTLPVDVTVTATTPVPGVLPLNFRVLLYFQEIVECPGACPTDQVVMSRSVIEKDVNQPLIGPGTTPVINLLIYKAVIRTQVTVTRVGMEGNRKHHHQHHHSQDSNQHCNPRQSDTINSPLRY